MLDSCDAREGGMDSISKSFCAQYLSQFPAIKLETIDTMCRNGYEDYYTLIAVDIDNDLPLIGDISLGQKSLLRKALTRLQRNLSADNNSDDNDIDHNDNDLMRLKMSCVSHLDLDNDTDDDVEDGVDPSDDEPNDCQHFSPDYADINNDLIKIEINSDVLNNCENSSQLLDNEMHSSHDLTANIKEEKEVIPLSLIESRLMPDIDYYKLLKTVRMPVIVCNKLAIDNRVMKETNDQLLNKLKEKQKTRKKWKLKENNSFPFSYKTKGPYKCDVDGCSYSGPSQHYLRMHKYRHTGEKNIFCHWPNCGFSSIWRHSVREHYYTHTKEKPHKCGWNGCTYSSAQSGNLAKHKRIHTGEKPYLCQVLCCGARFSNKTSLNTHMKIKHKTIIVEKITALIETIDQKSSAQQTNSILDINEKTLENISTNSYNSNINGFNSNNELLLNKEKVKRKRGRPRKTELNRVNSDFKMNCFASVELQTTRTSNDTTNDYQNLLLNLESISPQISNQNNNITSIPSLSETRLDLKQIPDPSKSEFGDNYFCDDIDCKNEVQTHLLKKKNNMGKNKPDLRCVWPGCDFSTLRKTVLRNHHKHEHGLRDYLQIKCDLCDYSTCYSGNIKRHKIKKHGMQPNESELMHSRERCKSGVKAQSSLELSCESNDIIEDMTCGWSGCSFATKNSQELVEHRRQQHTGKLEFRCDIPQCFYETARYNSLVIHKRRYHRIENSIDFVDYHHAMDSVKQEIDSFNSDDWSNNISSNFEFSTDYNTNFNNDESLFY